MLLICIILYKSYIRRTQNFEKKMFSIFKSDPNIIFNKNNIDVCIKTHYQTTNRHQIKCSFSSGGSFYQTFKSHEECTTHFNELKTTLSMNHK